MSAITRNCNIDSLNQHTSLRVVICASLAAFLTALTMQVINSAAGTSQSAQVQSTVAFETTTPLPTVTVVASR